MKVTLRIQRYNPEVDSQPVCRDYTVDVELTDRVLDALVQVKEQQDSTLAFRKSCAHGVCGSDAMRINGKNRLACKTLIRDVADHEYALIDIAPLQHFPVNRDLIVDQSQFFERFRAVKPFLINDEPIRCGERIQSEKERAVIEDATNCILCGACFSACPVLVTNPEFLGPAALVHAFRFQEDTRDRGSSQRLPILNTPNGVWACQQHFECTRACPRGIKVTKHITALKRKITAQSVKD